MPTACGIRRAGDSINSDHVQYSQRLVFAHVGVTEELVQTCPVRIFMTPITRCVDVDEHCTMLGLQKISQQFVAVFGQKAFRMKLHTVDGEFLMLQTHDFE